ncbi:cytochrome P450 [Streptomyces goshikiensis]|uniref:cytochrome P450 n=1 Tax=Streptomyces goshikiensis TaxID=1942 RepID=UPI00370F9D6F
MSRVLAALPEAPDQASGQHDPKTRHRHPAPPSRTAARASPERGRRAFGAGAHKCIGKDLALAEIAVAVAVICQRWRLRPVPGIRTREVIRIFVYPDQLPMPAKPRI